MKQLLTSIALFFSLTSFAQDDVLLSYQKDSVLVDSIFNDSTLTYEAADTPYYKTIYVLYDTTGDVANGNYTVKVSTMDSATLVMSLYQKAWTQFNRIGDFEGAKISALQSGAAYRKKATELVGDDGYRNYVMPMVRQAMQGNYILRYDNQIYRVNLLENGVARDDENTLIFTNVPLSSTWTVISYRIGEIDNVQVYKIREGIWMGDGSKGKLILRKL